KLTFILFILITYSSTAQNSMVGDGFGGRLWYQPTNYGADSYCAFSLCYEDNCSSNNQLFGWGGGLMSSVLPVPVPNMTNVKYFNAGYTLGAIKNDNTGWAYVNGFPVIPTQVISDAYF
ncbi:MAG: hypothetical protein P8Q14_07500, partial [Vicingaceae bacterium]|nr:hypothetical protein [Vicingaceae bacterium]